MDINNHIYTVRTPLGLAKAFRLANTNYLLTTDAILEGVQHCTVYDAMGQFCDTTIIAVDAIGCMGILYLHRDVSATTINYLSELVEDSYDVSIPILINDEVTVLSGYISNFVTNKIDQTIYYHSIALGTEDLGSPLVDENGFCIGINNSCMEGDEVIFFGNPIKNYLELIAKYEDMVFTNNNKPHVAYPILHRCEGDTAFRLFHKAKEMNCCLAYQESALIRPKLGDISVQISKMLTKLNFDVNQSKMNKNAWEVINGSARISIVYHESKGLLLADAILANSKNTSDSGIYEYLLKQNYILEGLTFSVVDQEIILSMKVYDNYLEFDTMINLFKKLIQKADELDDVLGIKLQN